MSRIHSPVLYMTSARRRKAFFDGRVDVEKVEILWLAVKRASQPHLSLTRDEHFPLGRANYSFMGPEGEREGGG